MNRSLLQAGAGWHFDPRSALIGALIAWLIAFWLYRRRTVLREKIHHLLAPLIALRQRWQRSAEEKYLVALQRMMRARLLGQPRTLEAVVIPPIFLAERQLPASLLDADRRQPPMQLPPEALLQGYPRLLLLGSEGEGRTTALIALAMQALDGGEERPFPLWLDLARLSPQREEKTAAEWLAELASRSLPRVQESWLAKKLLDGTLLFLVDGWDTLAEDIRPWVAARLAEAAEALPQARWIVAASPRGCGWLTERRFVPLTLRAVTPREALALYEGWASVLERPVAAEFEALLRRAIAGGDGYLHLTLRILLHLRYGTMPERFADLLRAWLDRLLPRPAGEEGEDREGAEVERLTLAILQSLAYRSRVEGLPIDAGLFREAMAELLPPEAERSQHLAEQVKRRLDRSRLLVKVGHSLEFRHFAWADLFAALALVERGEVLLLLHHLDDPAWHFLVECSVALGGGEALVRRLLQRAVQQQDVRALLQVARWTILAPEDVAWRKPVLMALARTFTQGGMALETRLEVGRALALVAGEEARPFYLRALRHPDLEVRAAALRGLGWTGTPREMPLLSAAVDDPHQSIREAAVRALGDLGTGGALRLLRDLLYQGDEALLLVVAETLASAPAGWEVLKEAAEDADLLVRRAAAHGLGQVPKLWAERVLTRLAREDGEWLVRSAADAALAARAQRKRQEMEIPAPPQVDALPWLINWAAQQGLGVGAGEAAYAALLHALEHGEPEAKILAARTLLRIGRQEDVEVLRRVVRSVRDVALRRRLAEVLRTLEERYAAGPPATGYGSSEAK